MSLSHLNSNRLSNPEMFEIRPSNDRPIEEQSTTTAGENDHQHPPEEPPKHVDEEAGPPEPEQEKAAPHTVLSEKEKITTICIAAIVSFLSPVSADIYYPALNLLSEELNVTRGTLNLTITAFMIVQAVAPIFIGSFSDSYGRRPAMLLCLITCVGMNIGLALQHSYAALLVLRCFQAFGSSTTVLLSSAVTADLVTRAERGKYMAYSSLGLTLGPALGPLTGGILVQFLGWQSTFWFLAIWSGVMLVVVFLILPETCRSVVGNGSIPPQRWNRSIKQMFWDKPVHDDNADAATLAPPVKKKRATPMDSARVSCEKETACLLIFSALLFAGYSMVLSSMPSQLGDRYDFDSLEIGLCYLPYGFGALTSRWTTGSLIDWNFRRQAAKKGVEIQRNKQPNMSEFPVEAARLQITIPLVYAACVGLIGYGWVMNFRTHLAGPLIMLFILAHAISGATSTLVTLIVDCHVDQPATATAAATFFRFLLGAGAVAVAVPMIDAMGIGWMGTLIAFLLVLCSGMLWAVLVWGFKWRLQYKAKKEKKQVERELKKKEKLGLGPLGVSQDPIEKN